MQSLIRRWPKARVGRAQHALAQHAAMGVHQREGGVVADRADVAEMVGEALELGHSARSQTARGGTSISERRLDRARKGEGIGDGAIAGRAAGELRRRARGRRRSCSPSMPLWA